jgi:hypothetical protein
MAIISQIATSDTADIAFARFFREWRVGALLRRCNFNKEKGVPCLQLLQLVFSLVFGHKNLFQTLQKPGSTLASVAEKDTVYRFLNSCRYNWRKLLLLLVSNVISTAIEPLTSADRESVLIVDDSMFSRDRSKKVELLARVFDHVTGRFMKGFRMLTLGWSDGNTFLPVAFSLLSSANETNRLNGVSASVDKRTVGYRRRAEAMQKGTDTLISLIDQAQRSGIQARYVLFDSWFAFPKTILRVLDQKLDVICMLKAMPNVFFGYGGQKLNLKALYGKVKKRSGRAGVLAAAHVIIGNDAQGNPVPAQIVFVKNRCGGREWLAILSTDVELPPEEVVRIYGKRWDIEVFFKMCKSHLGLAKEFQGRSYDMMVAHTTIVFMRYIMLAIQAREHEDPRTFGILFYHCCDELQDRTFASALILIMDLLKQAVGELLVISETQIQEVFGHFLSKIPAWLSGFFGSQACES